MTRNRYKHRGITLIDLMVALSLLSIAGVMFGPLMEQRRVRVIESAQEERALQWLEYEADALLAKVPSDPAVVERLRAGLPDSVFTMLPPGADKAATLRVEYRSAAGRIRTVELKLAGVKP